MKKLVILRGHQGSGKSTFAKTLLRGFELSYDGATTYEVSYDNILIRENNGEYAWSPENIKKAMFLAWEEFKSFIKMHTKRDENVLVVHSATNRSLKSFKDYMVFAKARGYEVEIIRLTNFFQNEHNCSDSIVAETFVAIEQHPIDGETILPCEKGPSEQMLLEIEKFRAAKNPELNPNTNSYVSSNYLKMNANKIRAKASEKYPELKTYKYTNRVFYNNEFDDALLELRGLILDDEDNIIVRPFNKAFNLSERRARNSKFPLRVSDDDRFHAVKKINGFLGCATYVYDEAYEGKSFNGRILYSTTGSLDSWFANTVREHLEKYENLFISKPNHTFMFEIVDERDPHVIPEYPGEYILACRDVFSGSLLSRLEISSLVSEAGDANRRIEEIMFPQIWYGISFKELQKLNKISRFEGFVVYDLDFKEIVFKLKTPLYLITKFLGRRRDLGKLLSELKDHKVTSSFINKYSIDEEFFPLIEHLSKNIQYVLSLDEQGRMAYIREFLATFED